MVLVHVKIGLMKGHVFWWVQIDPVPDWWEHQGKKTSRWSDAPIMPSAYRTSLCYDLRLIQLVRSADYLNIPNDQVSFPINVFFLRWWLGQIQRSLPSSIQDCDQKLMQLWKEINVVILYKLKAVQWSNPVRVRSVASQINLTQILDRTWDIVDLDQHQFDQDLAPSLSLQDKYVILLSCPGKDALLYHINHKYTIIIFTF